MASSSPPSLPKTALDRLVHDARFLTKPVFPSTEGVQVELERKVQDCAETFYRIGRESIVPPSGCATTPQGFVLTRYSALNPKTDTLVSSLVSEAEELAFKRFKDITRKYLLGGLMGPPTTASNEERYVFETLSCQPANHLKRKDIVSFITARCSAGDVAFFIRLARKLKSSDDANFDPFHKIDYALARYWTHPWMPLWMMTDEAGSRALSAAIREVVQKRAYEKVRKALEMPSFPRRAIREVKIFKNREMEYVYFRWVQAGSKKG